MTALPLQPPRLLTVAEFAALSEDPQARYELQEGHVVMSPRPNPDHRFCLRALSAQLGEQVPAAFEVLLAVEIISPGTHRTDTVVKHGEYADAGIPHYWIVDIAGRVSLTGCHPGGEFGYLDAAARTGIVTLSEPFAARLDLDALR